jgi:ribosomal protein S18 acetylase RimI-like enzyme
MVLRLPPGQIPEIQQLLRQDPVANLFGLGLLNGQPFDRATWIGRERAALDGVVLLIPGRLAVPFAPDTDAAEEIGGFLRGRFAPCMVVGPREASDALWDAWTQGDTPPLRRYDQRLYVLRDRPVGPDTAGFRLARPDEWRTIAARSAAMELEDLGRDPRVGEPRIYDRVVKDRIERERTWVYERGGVVVFHIHVGSATDHGCQVGGTYVPPDLRGHGVATVAMRSLGRELLRRFPLVTLHVNEANEPAVRLYERVGFVRDAAFRLITV